MLIDFLNEAQIAPVSNQLTENHDTFALDEQGNMVITYQDFEGKLLRWHKSRKRPSAIGSSDTLTETYTRKRILNPEGGRKYLSSKGQPTRLFLNGLHAFELWESDFLVITEGEKKAFVGCHNHIPTVGIQGIHNAVNSNKDSAGNKSPELIADVPILFERMRNLKKVILLFDSDCREGSADRRKGFSSAVLNFIESVQEFQELDFWFAHIKEGLSSGLDDLLIKELEHWDTVQEDLSECNLKSPYFAFIRLTGSRPRNIIDYFNKEVSLQSETPDLLDPVIYAYHGGQLEEVELLERLMCKSWMFNASLNRWMQYKGGKWHHEDNTGKGLPLLIGKLLKKLYFKFRPFLINTTDAKELEKKNKEFDKRLKSLSTSGYLKGLIELLSGQMSCNAEQTDRQQYVLNCMNGELDLETGDLFPHNPKSLITKQCKASYEPEAPQPERFLKFLRFILENDKQMVSFFQTWAGLCLSGCTDWQAFLYAYGGGGNGKSTIAKMMYLLLGDYAKIMDIDVIMGTKSSGADDYKVAATKGARLVIGTEIAKNYPMNEARIKSLTGGDPITARPIFGQPITFDPTAKYFFYGNHKLTVKGQDEGIWRRIYMCEFMKPIPKDEQKGMEEVMQEFAEEYPGILNWALEGFQRFLKDGKRIPKPGVIERYTKQYRRESDLLADFIDEEITEIPNKKNYIYLEDIFKAYIKFCDERKEDRGFRSTRMFKQAMQERGFKFEVMGSKRKNALRGWEFIVNLPDPIGGFEDSVEKDDELPF